MPVNHRLNRGELEFLIKLLSAHVEKTKVTAKAVATVAKLEIQLELLN